MNRPGFSLPVSDLPVRFWLIQCSFRFLSHLSFTVNRTFLEANLEPVGSRDDRAGKNYKQDRQNQATAAARARTPAPKAEGVLQPVEQPREQK
jgi:hypothetical protein